MDNRSALLVRRSKDNMSIAYSRRIYRKEELKREGSFKIRKAVSSKMSTPLMQSNRQQEIQPLRNYITASSWLVHDTLRKKTFGMKHAVEKEIASLTKIMTCIIVLEMIEKHAIDHDVRIRISKGASCMPGTSANLPEGYWIRLIDLLYGLMLPSGNDAAYLLAQAFGLLMFYEKIKPEENLYENIVSIDLTSYESTANFSSQFVKAMNRKCKMLGLATTNFTNPHGMTTSVNVSSAKDLLTLSIYCHKNAQFMKIASAKEYVTCIFQMPEDDASEGIELEWRNTNRLLQLGWEGIKTGQTQRAGACLISVRDGIFIVVLNSMNSEKRFEDSQLLYEWYLQSQRSSSQTH